MKRYTDEAFGDEAGKKLRRAMDVLVERKGWRGGMWEGKDGEYEVVMGENYEKVFGTLGEEVDEGWMKCGRAL